MIRKSIEIFIFLLCAATALSCSTEDGRLVPLQDGVVVITGSVSEAGTGAPLQDVRITLEAKSESDITIDRKTSYSTSDGIFTIRTGRLKKVSRCILTANAKEGYEDSNIEVVISPDEYSYNPKERILHVNDCNFYMQKTE